MFRFLLLIEVRNKMEGLCLALLAMRQGFPKGAAIGAEAPFG